jgi:hypothetical protein
MMKTIVIAGDVLVQENLFINESATRCRSVAHSQLDVRDENEGAWRLAELVHVAVSELDAADLTMSAPVLASAASLAVTVWTPFPPVYGEKVKDKDRIWRMEKHLGTKRRLNPEVPSYGPDVPPCPDVLHRGSCPGISG